MPMVMVVREEGQEPQAPASRRYTTGPSISTNSTLPPSAIRYGRTWRGGGGVGWVGGGGVGGAARQGPGKKANGARVLAWVPARQLPPCRALPLGQALPGSTAGRGAEGTCAALRACHRGPAPAQAPTSSSTSSTFSSVSSSVSVAAAWHTARRPRPPAGGRREGLRGACLGCTQPVTGRWQAGCSR